MTKYISKAEPSHVFNISENNRYYRHVLGRRLGAMEVVFLITGETICNSSATVNFLQTDPPNIRSKALLPVESLLQNPENPYYIDTIENTFDGHMDKNLMISNMKSTISFMKYVLQVTLPQTQ